MPGILFAGLAIAFGAAHAASWQPISSAPAASPATPSEVLAGVRRAYRAGPLAERVSIRIVHPSVADRRATVLVRLDAGRGKRPARVLLEMGKLRVFATDRELTVTDARDDETAYGVATDAPLSPEFLRRELPPLPLPQLAWAFGDAASSSTDILSLPPAPAVTWESIQQADPRDTDPRSRNALALIGSSSAGEAKLVLDRVTFRVRQLTLPLAGGGRIELSIARIEPRDPDGWPIRTDTRRFVASLADLGRIAGDRTPSRETDQLPIFAFFADDLEAISFPLLFTAATEPKPPAAALILFRAKGDGEADTPGTLADARTGCNAAATVLAELGAAEGDVAGTTRFAVYAVGVFGLTTINPDGLARSSIKWAACAPALWCGSDWESLADIVEGNSALVLVKPDRRIIGVVPLEGRADDESAIAAELRAVLDGSK